MSGVVRPLCKTTDLKKQWLYTCSDLWLTIYTSIKGLLGLCRILQNFVQYSHWDVEIEQAGNHQESNPGVLAWAISVCHWATTTGKLPALTILSYICPTRKPNRCPIAQPDIWLCNGTSHYVTGLDFGHIARLLQEREWRLSDCCEDAKEAFEAYVSSTSPIDRKRTRSAVIRRSSRELSSCITGQLLDQHYQVAFKPPSCTTRQLSDCPHNWVAFRLSTQLCSFQTVQTTV